MKDSKFRGTGFYPENDFYLPSLLPEMHITHQAFALGEVALKPVTGQTLLDSGLWDDYDHSVNAFLPKGEEQAVIASPTDILDVASTEQAHIWGIHAALGDNGLQLVGITGLLRIPSRCPETATFILNPAARGKGVGTLAKIGLIEYAFKHLNKEAVRSQTLAVNDASQTSLIKSGFVQLPPHPSRILVPYGAGTGQSLRTYWMAFNPEGRIYPPHAFGGLDPAKIAASRHAVVAWRQRASVDVQWPPLYEEMY